MKNYNTGRNHLKFIDLTGKKIGQLHLIDYIHVESKNNNNRWVWECQCDCGNKCYVRTLKFTKDNPQSSCKVCSDNKWSKIRILNSFLSLRRRIYRTYQRSAKNRNYEFNLTFEQVDSIIQQNCYYCNIEPVENKGDQVYTWSRNIQTKWY